MLFCEVHITIIIYLNNGMKHFIFLKTTSDDNVKWMHTMIRSDSHIFSRQSTIQHKII